MSGPYVRPFVLMIGEKTSREYRLPTLIVSGRARDTVEVSGMDSSTAL